MSFEKPQWMKLIKELNIYFPDKKQHWEHQHNMCHLNHDLKSSITNTIRKSQANKLCDVL